MDIVRGKEREKERGGEGEGEREKWEQEGVREEDCHVPARTHWP